jgi:hypothetical protein
MLAVPGNPKRFIVLLCLFLVFVSDARASDTPPLLHQSRFTRWNSDNGLPAGQVYGVVQTRDGYIWAATVDGLARCDGMNFTFFNTGNTPGISDNRFTCVFEDGAGRLWAGTEFGTIVRYERGAWTSFSLGASGEQIQAICIREDESGVIWAIGGKEPFELVGDRFVVRPKPEWRATLEAGVQFRVLNFGIAHENALLAMVRGRPVLLTASDGLPSLQGGTVFLDKRGMPVAQTADGRRFGLRGERFELLEADDVLARLPARGVSGGVFEDSRGNVWYATTSMGVARLNADGSTTQFGPEDGLSDWVAQFIEDREGTIWLAGGHGLYRYDGELISYFAGAGDRPLTVDDVAREDDRGRVWLARYDHERFKPGISHRRATLGWVEGGRFVSHVTVTIPMTDREPAATGSRATRGSFTFATAGRRESASWMAFLLAFP